WLFCDGGTGSLLQQRGLKPGELPERWNLTHPEDMIAIAQGYYEAGSDIVNTNTFGANALKYPDDLRQIVEASVRLVDEARRRADREDAYIALDLGPTGKLLQPMGDLPFEKAVELFGEVAKIGAGAGADLVLIETMSDSYEAKAAVLGVKENCDLPVCVTLTYDKSGKMLTGGTVKSTTAMLEGLGVAALGINCGLGPAQMLPLVRELLEVASVPVIVNPNAGLPRSEKGNTVYDISPDEFAFLMEQIAKEGVHVLGGCCGTTPDHIRAVIDACSELPFQKPIPKHKTFVSSYAQAVEIGKQPVIIGERINPTGKKRFQQALREKNMDYILQQAIEQEESGAQILDVNVGLPGIDEAEMMRQTVTALQAITTLPLQIDTSDLKALEAGLRYYNGKPMVNSVNGKQESLETVLPLVKKYGGVLVGLALDEKGIPETAKKRLQVADRIYAAAEEAGIPREDIVIDGLAMTISSDSASAKTTLETLRLIRDERGGHSILGVSNISFGLPRRDVINSTFFTMAMQEGLSCAIINPNNEDMMRAYYSYLALSNMDPQCTGYIEQSALWSTKTGPAQTEGKKGKGSGIAAPGKNETNPAQTDLTDGLLPGALAASIERGMARQAGELAAQALKTRDSMELVNTEVIPALDKVGKGFEKGFIFLPQLLMSAEAAQSAFAVIKESLQGSDAPSRGTIILATVKNDIHDIGKNIVKVMLENYSYRVIDLGKDVAPEVIVEAAIRENIRLVGLSALMTTTVSSMEETVRLLREKKPDTKVVVGGAVLTQEYANQIGADAYARDAMETVRYADQVFGG
ncbi:MAG: homocysteine S-methyltransferase family protein, partial [Lachnospiraceae bacterium]|nr:homocysteine S-methyltransferase family protein [Lachnospiraceae bacterium]